MGGGRGRSWLPEGREGLDGGDGEGVRGEAVVDTGGNDFIFLGFVIGSEKDIEDREEGREVFIVVCRGDAVVNAVELGAGQEGGEGAQGDGHAGVVEVAVAPEEDECAPRGDG